MREVIPNSKFRIPNSVHYSASPSINGNTIQQNASDGIFIHYKSQPTILDNAITLNNKDGIRIDGYYDQWNKGNPQPIINNNEITDNATALSLVNYQTTTTIVDATYNYWGTKNEEEIVEMIYDAADASGGGTVEWKPYLPGPPGPSPNDDALLAIDFLYSDNSGADSIEPRRYVSKGDNFYVYVVARDVVNLATYNCVITFDPAVLTYVEAKSELEGIDNILEINGGSQLGLQVDDTNAALGRLEFTNSLQGTSGAPSGNGLLCVIKFTKNADGGTEVKFGTGFRDNFLISVDGIDETSFLTDKNLQNGMLWGLLGDIASAAGEGIPDGYVDAFDLHTMGGHWHESNDLGVIADIASPSDGGGEGIPDGCVDGFDLHTMGAHWHEGTPPAVETIIATITPEGTTSNDDVILAVDFVYEDDSGADTIENTTKIAVGKNFYAYIVAQDVVNLATYNIIINFDPSILTYVEADSGIKLSFENILESEGGEMLGLMVDDSDAANGKLELTNTLAGKENPPSGNGLLAVIKFTVQSAGETQISFGTGATDNYLISVEGITDTSFISNGQLLSGVVNQTNWGDVSGDGHVSTYDAALILQKIVGLIQFTPEQEAAADVSGAGGVTAYDAALILQYVVGIISEFPAQSGDAAPTVNTNTRRYHVHIGNAFAKAGESINVPIIADDATDIIAGNITIEYDASLLKPVGVSITALTAEYSQEYSINNGQLSAAFAGKNPLVGSGNLVMLAFEVLPDAKAQNARLTLTNMRLNDGLKAEVGEGCIEIIPSQTALGQNYPNPFNPETWIPFDLANPGEVTIRIYNLKGQFIRTLYLGNQPAGRYVTKSKAAYWDGRNKLGEKVSSGIYFYQIQVGDFQAMRKMFIVK